ncbi:MAG: hypothetical protein HY675_19290 [Chloroflexi bacterium]|nr:hypothetical protein [Chloroflexota bacterium]
MRQVGRAVAALQIPRAGTLASFAVLIAFMAIVWPLTSLVHEVTVNFAAALLNVVTSSAITLQLLDALPVDKVYSSVAFSTIGNIRAQGVAVAEPLGHALHELLPPVFAEPELVAQGAWTSAVVASGSSLAARLLAVSLSGALLVFLGAILIQAGLSGRRLGLTCCGLSAKTVFILAGALLQVRVVTVIFGLTISFRDIEVMGLSLVFTKLLRLTPESYAALEATLDPFVSAILPVAVLASIFAVDLCVLKACVVLVSRRVRESVCPGTPEGQPCELRLAERATAFSRRLVTGSSAPVFVLLLVAGAGQDFARAKTNYTLDALPAIQPSEQAVVVEVTTTEPEVVPTPTPLPTPTPKPTPRIPVPSVVKIAGGNMQYVYTVNGVRQTIRGIGYNVNYFDLPERRRARLYDRDFAKMREMGINTILGWDQNLFDQVTLAKADEYGIGVVLPYHLPPEGNYLDPEYRESLKDKVITWVKRYKDQPALRMWGLGNEVLHDIKEKRQSKPFAEFYRDLAESVHEVDPNHPIIYREAEDVFVPTLKKALAPLLSDEPWLVYGVNIFTYRMGKVLTNWQEQGFDVPLVISEYGPTGLGPSDRPAAYLRMWGLMRRHPNLVLGGFMYVWSTNGPEALDRVFGLVDENNHPTDQTVEMMAATFAEEIQEEKETVALPPKDASETRVGSQ